MKPPIKSDYETQEQFQDRFDEYESHRATIIKAYTLSAIIGIVIGILLTFVNYIWPR